MIKKTIVRKSVYYDSVKLMLVTREIKNMEGVKEVAVVMGTDLNKESLERTGLITEESALASATDMIVGICCEDEGQLNEIFQKLDHLLNANASGSDKEVYRPKSVETALKIQPGSNICTISIPGRYARDMAMEALQNGLHVMLFSDNVTLEEELELKTFARKKDLLVMGPDCGTAMINQAPLCFCNKIRRGNIGIVAASGTGAQEVMTLIHKNGGGVTQVIGTGGRDLKEEIGGITTIQALEALNEDEATEIITLISKPPSKKIADQVISYIRSNVKKNVVINFLGGDRAGELENICFTPTLEQAALKSLELSGIADSQMTLAEPDNMARTAEVEAGKIRKTGKYVRGLFSGGTLGYEALYCLKGTISYISTNMGNGEELVDCYALNGNACIDLGDDVFTVGRAHPMIDPTFRTEIFSDQLRSPETAVILMDLVLGYGANPAPHQDLIDELAVYRQELGRDELDVSIIVSLCGSKDDPQDYDGIAEALKEYGVVIMPSNLKAAQMAAAVLERRKNA